MFNSDLFRQAVCGHQQMWELNESKSLIYKAHHGCLSVCMCVNWSDKMSWTSSYLSYVPGRICLESFFGQAKFIGSVGFQYPMVRDHVTMAKAGYFQNQQEERPTEVAKNFQNKG